MSTASPHAEERRFQALLDLDLLDTEPSESFDRITRMAARLFSAPTAAVSLTDRHRQWFKSAIGTAGREIPRDRAPCAVVAETAAMLVVPDMSRDPRFTGGTLDNAGVRFYAGAPLMTRDGHALGAMCVLDTEPRQATEADMAALRDLAAMVMSQVELERDFGRVDPVTGLPNRNQLLDDLEEEARRDPGATGVILLVSLGGAGHLDRAVRAVGLSYLDDLARAAVRAMRDVLQRRRGLYQVTPASYAIRLDGREEWEEVIAALAARLREPVVCGGVPVGMDASFGVSAYDLGSVAPGDVLRTAIGAAHAARDTDRKVATHDLARDAVSRRSFGLLADFRHALEGGGQLHLVYQPRIGLGDGACASVEALLRWTHPRLGPVSPGEFVPLVEQTAMAGPMTAWVLSAALSQAAAWRAAGAALRVSVNVSVRDLVDGFAASLDAALRHHGVPPEQLELEVTESAVMRDGEAALRQLDEVRALGVEVAIDDFGTGYSTFSYLKRVPATIVKLDRSFLGGVTERGRDRRLVASIIGLAHELGYRVVAEGVETRAEEDVLAELGCDEVQGYLHARPMPPAELGRWLGGRAASAAGAPRLMAAR